MNYHIGNKIMVDKKRLHKSFWKEFCSLSGDKIIYISTSVVMSMIELYIFYSFVVISVSLPGIFDTHNYFIEVPVVIIFREIMHIISLLMFVIQLIDAYYTNRLTNSVNKNIFIWLFDILHYGYIGQIYKHITSLSIISLIWFELVMCNYSKVNTEQVIINYPYVGFLLWAMQKLIQINWARGFAIALDQIKENAKNDI